MLSESKKWSIKNIITEILHENQSNKKKKSIRKVEIEDDLYEAIASGYKSVLGAAEEDNDNIAFRKVAVVIQS